MPPIRDDNQWGQPRRPRPPMAGGPAAVDRPAKARKLRPAPLPLAASVTTTWAALVSFAPILVVVAFLYAIDSGGDPAARVPRLAVAGWLLAHGVPLTTGNGVITLAPLMVSVFVAWRVIRAGVHTARAIGARHSKAAWPTVAAGVAVGAVYSVIGALAAAGARFPGLSVSPARASLTLGGFGLLAGLVGAAMESGMLTRLALASPRAVQEGVRTGAVATLLLLGAGAGAAGMAVAIAGGEATWALSSYRTGVIGQAGLTLVCALYGPNVAIWAASYLVGPGFVIGTDNSVTAASASLGDIPNVPVLAGLDAVPTNGSVLVALPLVAGLTAGWLMTRRTRRAVRRGRGKTGEAGDLPSTLTLLGAGAIAGAVSGAMLLAACAASSGALGSGRLSQIGPRVFPVSLLGAAVIGIGVIIAVAASRWLFRDRRFDAARRGRTRKAATRRAIPEEPTTTPPGLT